MQFRNYSLWAKDTGLFTVPSRLSEKWSYLTPLIYHIIEKLGFCNRSGELLRGFLPTIAQRTVKLIQNQNLVLREADNSRQQV